MSGITTVAPRATTRKRRGHHEGTLVARADGRWEARVSLPGGKRKSYYAATRDEARRKLTEALRDLDRGVPLPSGGGRLGPYLADWLAAQKARLAPSTWRVYESMTRTRVTPALGSARLATLTPARVQRFYGDLMSGPHPLAAASARHVHALLRHALTDAVRSGLVARNVCELVAPPRLRRREMRVWSAAEARTFLAAARARGDRNEPLYALALATGMRQSELLGLSWRAVDLAAGTLQVVTTQQRIGGAWTYGSPKTARSRRRIAIGTGAREALSRQRALTARERLALGAAYGHGAPAGAADLVFPDEIGWPLGAYRVGRAFHATSDAAGVPRVRFHDLRHTAATLLLLADAHPKVVSELLGHASIQMTLDTYSHVLPDMHARVVAALDALLANG